MKGNEVQSRKPRGESNGRWALVTPRCRASASRQSLRGRRMVRSLLERIDAVHGKHMAAKTEVEAKMWEVVDAWKKTTEQHV